MKKLLISIVLTLMLVVSSFSQSTNLTLLTYRAGTNLVLIILNTNQFNTNIPISLQNGLAVTNLTVVGTLTATNLNGIGTNAVAILAGNGIIVNTNTNGSFTINTNGVGGGGGGGGTTVVVGGTGITSVSNNSTNFTINLTTPVIDGNLSTNIAHLNTANQHWNGPQLFDNGFSGTGSNLSSITANIGTLTLTNALADSMLSTNVALRNATQNWAGQQNFTNNNNTYNGTFNGVLSSTNAVSFPGGIQQFGSGYQMNPSVTAAGNVKWFLMGNTNYQTTNQASSDSSTVCLDVNPYNSGSAWSVIPSTTNASYAFGAALSTNSAGVPIYEAFDDIGTSFVVTSLQCTAPGDLPGVAQIVRNANVSSAGDPNEHGRFGARFAITSATIVGGIPGNYAYIMTDPFNGYLHFPLWQGGKFTFDNIDTNAIALDAMLLNHNTGVLNVLSNLNIGGGFRVTNGNIVTVNGIFAALQTVTNSETNDYFAQGNIAYQTGNGSGMKGFQSQGGNVLGFGDGNRFCMDLVSQSDGWLVGTASLTIGDTELKSITNCAHSALEVHGSIGTAYHNVATNYTAAGNDSLILISSSGKTVTLPDCTGNFGAADLFAGRIYTIKLIVPGSATVATTSSQTIDGATTYSLGLQNKYVTVQTDHTNWWVIANN